MTIVHIAPVVSIRYSFGDIDRCSEGDVCPFPLGKFFINYGKQKKIIIHSCFHVHHSAFTLIFDKKKRVRRADKKHSFIPPFFKGEKHKLPCKTRGMENKQKAGL